MADKMNHSLLNPNQMRHDGTIVQDNPFKSGGPFIFRDNIHIPLQTFGTIVGCNTWAPSDVELQTHTHVHLTNEQQWDPNEMTIRQTNNTSNNSSVKSILRYHDNELARYIGISEVTVNDVYQVQPDVPIPRTFYSNERHTKVTAAQLSDRWYIGLGQATNLWNNCWMQHMGTFRC
jgi:hypothetical protein